MSVTQELLIAVCKDLVKNERATRDNWINTKAFKALMEHWYNFLKPLKIGNVTKAIKAAVDQRQDEDPI